MCFVLKLMILCWLLLFWWHHLSGSNISDRILHAKWGSDNRFQHWKTRHDSKRYGDFPPAFPPGIRWYVPDRPHVGEVPQGFRFVSHHPLASWTKLPVWDGKLKSLRPCTSVPHGQNLISRTRSNYRHLGKKHTMWTTDFTEKCVALLLLR